MSERPALTFADRAGPGIWDALRGDPSLHFDREALSLYIADQQRWSRTFLLPVVRVLSRVAVGLIVVAKRLAPFQFSSHRTLDRLGIWFLSRCVSPEGGALLLRHFVVETNVLAFIARNTGLAEADLRPTRLDQLDDGAVIVHDLNVYELLAGLAGKRLGKPGEAPLDYSMLTVPPIEVGGRRWLRLDLETGLCCMNLAFAFFTTSAEYRRAVHSLSLDESLLGILAELTGDEAFRSWRPAGYALQVRTNRDVPRHLVAHAVVHEYIHARLASHASHRARKFSWGAGWGPFLS